MKPWFHLPENPSEGLLSAEEWVFVGTTFGLTVNELAIATLIFEDRTRRSMAFRVHRSTGAIRKRIDKVFKKMNVKDKLGLVQRVWQVCRRLDPSDRSPAFAAFGLESAACATVVVQTGEGSTKMLLAASEQPM